MSEFKVNAITNRGGGYGPQVCGITTFGSSGMQLPSGPTEFRGGRGRGVTYGGVFSGTYKSEMNVMDISTTGSAVDFGDASKKCTFSSGMASATRGVFKQGRSPSTTGIMEYVTFSSLGGAYEFGSDEGIQQDSSAPAADGIRGIFGNGTGYDGVIRQINIPSTGDSSTFGTLSAGRYMGGGAGGASPTRGFFFGGRLDGSPAGEKIIETVTFASGGEATKFGELTIGRRAIAAVTDNTRAVSCSGDTPATNRMDYITMASEGNAIDFGDIANQANGYGAGGSNATRGVLSGSNGGDQTRMDYITIQTTGDAVDFGDSTYGTYLNGACSDSHGGLVL